MLKQINCHANKSGYTVKSSGTICLIFKADRLIYINHPWEDTRVINPQY